LAICGAIIGIGTKVVLISILLALVATIPRIINVLSRMIGAC